MAKEEVELGDWGAGKKPPAKADSRALHMLRGKVCLGVIERCQEATRSPMFLTKVGKASAGCRAQVEGIAYTRCDVYHGSWYGKPHVHNINGLLRTQVSDLEGDNRLTTIHTCILRFQDHNIYRW